MRSATAKRGPTVRRSGVRGILFDKDGTGFLCAAAGSGFRSVAGLR